MEQFKKTRNSQVAQVADEKEQNVEGCDDYMEPTATGATTSGIQVKSNILYHYQLNGKLGLDMNLS